VTAEPDIEALLHGLLAKAAPLAETMGKVMVAQAAKHGVSLRALHRMTGVRLDVIQRISIGRWLPTHDEAVRLFGWFANPHPEDPDDTRPKPRSRSSVLPGR